MTRCDRCLAELRDGYEWPPAVDPERGLAIIGSERRRLSPSQIDALGVLWTRRGRPVHQGSLARLVWGKRELRSPDTAVREMIRQLRRRCAGLPFTIVTDFAHGYTLVPRDG